MCDDHELYNKLENISKLAKDLINKEKQKRELSLRINELEEECKKLELQTIENRSKTGFMIFHNLYNLTLLLVLIFFVVSFIDKFVLATILQRMIYVIEIYAGVIAISVLGALISNKIDVLIKKNFIRKNNYIHKRIENNKNNIKILLYKKDVLDKEFNVILADLISESDIMKYSQLKSKSDSISDTIDVPIYNSEDSKPFRRVRTNRRI